MAKRKKEPKVRPATDAPEKLNAGAFSGLAGLVDALPPGPPATTPEPGTAPPAPTELGGRLVVRREKKGRGGKTVTRVQGLTAAQAEGLLPEIKKALGCGAVQEDRDIVLLGHLTARAASWLRARGATVVEGN